MKASKSVYRPPVHIVWFKRDLRVQDHRALHAAAQLGAVLPLYIAEPELWLQPDMSARQWLFVRECLHKLRQDLAGLGQALIVRCGQSVDVLNTLSETYRIQGLWSHEETGNAWTYLRDQRVAGWCKSQSIDWREIPQHGVQRRLTSRNGWAKAWDQFMAMPQVSAPQLTPLDDLDVGGIPSTVELGLEADICPDRQIGGRPKGLDCLNSFLTKRGHTYRSDMSNPLAGEQACSRLSPHLAFGTLSMREIAQATWAQQSQLKQAATVDFGL
jgi:deoxyribodipyrimidine photo-lyase